ncbi:MAG: hypothetical protein QXV01_11465 [Candidatus Bathyarchaeia archaeon]
MLHARFVVATVSLIFIIALVAFSVSPAFCYDEDEARAAVETVEGEVLSCYRAVADAQAAGANVSDLLSTLNEAEWLLSKAKLAYSQKDFNSTVVYTEECLSLLGNFVEQAEVLRQDAEAANRWDFMVNFVGSGAGAVCVIVGGSALWTFLKKREEVKEKT